MGPTQVRSEECSQSISTQGTVGFPGSQDSAGTTAHVGLLQSLSCTFGKTGLGLC